MKISWILTFKDDATHNSINTQKEDSIMNKSEDLSYAPEFYYHGLYIGRLEYIKDDEDDPDSKGKWIVWAGQRDTEADLDYYEPTAKTTIAAFRDEVEGYGYMFGTDYDHEDVESQMDNYDPNAGFEIW